MQRHLLNDPWFNAAAHRIGKFGLWLFGWKTRGEMPDLRKFVLIAAPHTSNWDFVFFLLIIFKFRIPVHWMGKQSMFVRPFNRLLKRLGGLPVDRSRSGNTVSRMARAFETADRLIITLAPSGTRQKVREWKTGFYQLALQANVPIVLGFVDYKRKIGGIGPTFIPKGDMQKAMAEIKAFYRDKSGRPV